MSHKTLVYLNGNGELTNFWNDLWLGDQLLKVKYPRLYALENNKTSSVAVKLAGNIEDSFRRYARAGAEAEQMVSLRTHLNSYVMSAQEDRWVWDLNGDGDFKVKDIRNMLDKFILPSEVYHTRWVKLIPIKINIFAWQVSMDRIPTKTNLQQRGILIEDNSCSICHDEEEDMAHILFKCEMAIALQQKICRWWQIGFQQVNSYATWLNWFKNIRMQTKKKLVLEGVFYISWWKIWSFRNQTLFGSSMPRRSTLFDDLIARSYTYVSSRCKTKISWSGWMSNPSYIAL